MIFTHHIRDGYFPEDGGRPLGELWDDAAAEEDHNPSCAYAFLLTLGFSAAPPAGWEVELAGAASGFQFTTWQGRLVGAHSAGNLAVSDDAAAVANNTIRLLIPRAGKTANDLNVTLSSSQHLSYASFNRVIAVLHPSPPIGANLAPEKETIKGLDGRIHATLKRPDPIFTASLRLDCWDDDAELADAAVAGGLDKFAIWPSGLHGEFTPAMALEYRRPAFARNMIVTAQEGPAGLDGLDAPGAPVSLRLKMKEAF